MTSVLTYTTKLELYKDIPLCRYSTRNSYIHAYMVYGVHTDICFSCVHLVHVLTYTLLPEIPKTVTHIYKQHGI